MHLTINAGDISYSYDVNGNRVEEQGSDYVKRFTYNADNLLVKYQENDDTAVQYGYDAINRRIYKALNSTDVTSYLYDGLKLMQELTNNDEGTLDVVAYYRSKGRLISRQEYESTGGSDSTYQTRQRLDQTFYSQDGMGNVVAMIDCYGWELTRYQYDAFGKVLAGNTEINEFTFGEQRLDLESGLYHFHFRQYDPTSGVWTTADPIGVLGGVNLYQYVRGNPVNFRDWLGLVNQCSDGEECDSWSCEKDEDGKETCTCTKDKDKDDEKRDSDLDSDNYGTSSASENTKSQFRNAITTFCEAIKGYIGGVKAPKSASSTITALGDVAFELEKQNYKAMKTGYKKWQESQKYNSEENPYCDKTPSYLPGGDWADKDWDNIGGGVDVDFEDLNWDEVF